MTLPYVPSWLTGARRIYFRPEFPSSKTKAARAGPDEDKQLKPIIF